MSMSFPRRVNEPGLHRFVRISNQQRWTLNLLAIIAIVFWCRHAEFSTGVLFLCCCVVICYFFCSFVIFRFANFLVKKPVVLHILNFLGSLHVQSYGRFIVLLCSVLGLLQR